MSHNVLIEKPKYRSVRTATVFRGETRVQPSAKPTDLADPFRKALTLKDVGSPHVETLMIDGPPQLPYDRSICSANTYVSDSSIVACELREKLKEMLVAIPVDVAKTSSEWKLDCVYYPDSVRTPFEVFLFRDESSAANTKNAVLIEMQLMGGNRSGFQHLCNFLRVQLDLKSAFCGTDWAPFYSVRPEQASKDAEYHYEPSRPQCMPPAPKPGNLTRSSSTSVSVFGDSEADGCANFVDLILNYLNSPFADVQRMGWQELARATTDSKMQDAVCKTAFDGTDVIHLAVVAIENNKCEDTVRCVLQTLARIYKSASVEQVRRIKNLQKQIVDFAQNGSSKEIRFLAVGLVHELLATSDVASKSCLLSTLKTCSEGECRVSHKAQSILSSLKTITC